MQRFVISLLALTALTLSAGAQTNQRRAALVGGGNADYGKCTAEVVVDGAAEVEIRGDVGTLRDVSGQPPQWRRLECTGPIPANPVNLRFNGIDGRGRQQLVRDPRNGGAAVVRIEDSQGGAEGYTFELTWGGGGARPYDQRTYDQRPVDPRAYDQRPADPRNYDQRPVDGWQARDRIQTGRFTTEQALSVCQDSVRQQAATQFRGRRIEFRNVRMDDNPGRNDWIVGRVDVMRMGGAVDHYRFSCSVNFDTGRVRSVQIDPMGDWRDRVYNNGANVALERCQGAVEQHLREEGYDSRMTFSSVRMDDRPGRNDWVVGSVRAAGRYGPQTLDFSCSVDLGNGSVRSVDVRHR